MSLHYAPDRLPHQLEPRLAAGGTSSGLRGVDWDVKASYERVLERARRVSDETVATARGAGESRAVEILLAELTDGSIDLTVPFRLGKQSERGHVQVRTDALSGVTAAFDESDVDIPFPMATPNLGTRDEQPLDGVRGKRSQDWLSI